MEIKKTDTFSKWETALRDTHGKQRVLSRIRHMSLGNFGDAKSVGDGVMESRIHCGPGYRLYYTIRGGTIVILLVGGDKSTQRLDIIKAKELARSI